MKKDNSKPSGQQNTCESIPKPDAISWVKANIKGCFGEKDKRFAQHTYDDERARKVIAYCKKNGVSPDELKEIILSFLHSNLEIEILIKENYDEAIKVLKSKKFV